MTKPFQIEALLGRIRVNLRQKIQLNQQANHLSIGELFVDLDRYEIKRGEQEIQLTPREFDLLVCLLKNKNIVLTREQLLDNVWGFQYVGDRKSTRLNSSH